jgi:hypothetical protein
MEESTKYRKMDGNIDTDDKKRHHERHKKKMRLRKHGKDSVRNTDENAHNTHGEKNSDVLAVALTDFVSFFFL